MSRERFHLHRNRPTWHHPVQKRRVARRKWRGPGSGAEGEGQWEANNWKWGGDAEGRCFIYPSIHPAASLWTLCFCQSCDACMTGHCHLGEMHSPNPKQCHLACLRHCPPFTPPSAPPLLPAKPSPSLPFRSPFLSPSLRWVCFIGPGGGGVSIVTWQIGAIGGVAVM